jgi:hypothetical protein
MIKISTSVPEIASLADMARLHAEARNAEEGAEGN